MSSIGNVKKFGNSKDLLTEEQQDVLRNKGMKIDRLQSEITHLSKPLLQSEGSFSWSKHVTPGTLSIFQDEKSWNGISNIVTKRKSIVKEFRDANGLSWSNMRDSLQLESEDDSLSEGGSPVTTRLDAKDMEIFGAMPMDEDIVVVKCNNCQRPLLPSKFKEHSVSCIGEKNQDAQDRKSTSKQKGFFSDDEEIDTKKNIKKKKAIDLDEEIDFSSSVAKRPPSASIEKNEKKKAKKEKQKKTTKQKAPLDLDKQCGVIQGLNNMPCTRSLTCKSHSMGAKRSVEGRSQPYDVLLAAYQKKSIGRPNGKEQVPKKKDGSSTNITIGNGMSGKSIKNLKKLQNQLSSGSSLNGNNGLNSGVDGSGGQTQTNEEAFIDSDEEVENIMQALKHSKPAPLAQKPFFFVKRKRQCYRLRDILLDAITPKSAALGENNSSLNYSGLDNSNNSSIRQAYFQQQQQQQFQQQQQQQQQQQRQQQQVLGFTGNIVSDVNGIFG